MGKNRPIVVATLGYIIGIIWGLYFKMNIVSFYALIYIFVALLKYLKVFKNKKGLKKKFKFISIQKIFRYIKLILDFKSVIIIIIFSVISNLTIIRLENKYKNLYKELEDVSVIAKVVDNGVNKEYKTTYKIKVEKINKKDKFKGTYLYLDVNKKLENNLKYGDYINLQGEYKMPGKATNYQGFDYSEYLKTLKIYGTIKAKQINVLRKDCNNILFTISNNILTKIKDIAQENISEEKANLLLGILVGEKSEISEQMNENFKESNISHILAVSGLHVSYIILAINQVLEKTQGKRIAKILTIFFIIVYMFITNFSPSVVRSGIMAIISILAKLTYNKNDIWTSMAFSILCILIYNPYLITSAGVLLSYGGTIGIIVFQKSVSQILKKITEKFKRYVKSVRMIDHLQDAISVSFSVQLVIAPIMAKMFNTISLSFFITNFFVGLIIGPIIILGFLFIISNFLFSNIIKISILQILFSSVIKFLLDKLLDVLIAISKLGNVLPLNKIYIVTPTILQIVIYYLMIFIVNIFYRILCRRKISVFEKRLINWKNLCKHLIRKKRQKLFEISLIFLIIVILIKIIPKDLKVYFIDVGQGDSSLIVTPQNKTILIDGGGSEHYNIGKNTLLPYLLDRKITKIDYVIISHFDTDHVGGILTILQELSVKKVIIGKQYDNCPNYEEFLKIIKEKNIFVKMVSKGDIINIEKDIQIKVLFPEEKLITENAINNNSLVLKLIYKDFSMLFTGDIEKITEERLIDLYINTKELKTIVLKVAHHGSNSSSIQEFLELIEPKIALIGVGKNNLYGHPNLDVLERINDLRYEGL